MQEAKMAVEQPILSQLLNDFEKCNGEHLNTTDRIAKLLEKLNSEPETPSPEKENGRPSIVNGSGAISYLEGLVRNYYNTLSRQNGILAKLERLI
jgi:hypothetical protein